MTARALVVSAPASGSGKTTIATGLMAALRRRGTPVAPFKVGPDYIDPGYHTLAAERPGRNLDPVLVGRDRIGPLVRHGAAGAEVAVVEGVMGLFDGRLSDGGGSTAQVAGLIGAPVVLVVDCRGQSRSLAALLHGFRSFDDEVRVAGVILNRVGSARHEAVLRAAADEVGLPVLGAVPRRAELAVPSRHLGLVTAVEHGAAATAAVDAMASLVAEHVDLDAVVRLAQPLPAGPAWSAVDAACECVTVLEHCYALTGTERPVVAIAGGPAFTFGYAEHVELLEAAGARVVVVDPLRDETLPEATAGLVLPGGFPEEHVAALSANASLRTAVAALAASGAPVHAECGGLLYLCADLDGKPMCGVLPASAGMSGRLTLGYREAVALTGSPAFAVGRRVLGHEFHRCAVTPRAGTTPAWGWRGADPEGFVSAGVHASFLHTHPAGVPDAVARFVAAAARPR
ncbi:cobyrinate a,c-diamide synthase [Pseudonocardia asaccharolytica]|uniref:Hydrogenobyrinate a,c-diamide synthase n=1 Tax=Pseudonocardia asaccharolytica DSM 44247 = NBRC 16224 TaxID=1123024 RepID=A0A511CY08_9PSEU|nr:cobyrinate a,c-diamide synthase [Pseudonocardia asaccharolytica]GEL17133.1 hydrogenobyrinate a,c-diamide synthase [Pseudonocardia asaccharolytica DSM 44247 = NBRC 16224]